MNPRLATALVFGTSFCILVIEILAGRLLAPIVGVSLETFTGIIGTVLAGIALGNTIGGRLADRHDPQLFIGPALVAGGIFTWLSVVLASILNPTPGAGAVTIVGLSTVLFFAPAVVLSTVSPLVAKLMIQSLDDSGKVVGNLSAAGTVGALAGSFMAGFVLVATIGTRTLFIVIGAVLVLAGASLTGWERVRENAVLAAIVVALPVGGALAVGDRCQAETSYACANLVVDAERPSGRSVVLNGFRNSYVDLDDPSYLEFRYARLMAGALDNIEPGPLRVVHVGGAGYTMARYLAAERPGSDQIVLEIDGDLVDFIADELGPVEGPDTEIVVGDARLTLSELETDSHDLIIGDAFSGLTVPWHLTTTQFVEELERVLTPDGTVMLNLVDGGEIAFAEASLATYAEHFDHVALIEPPGGTPAFGGFNFVLLASDEPIPAPRIDAEDGLLIDAGRTARLVADGLVLDDDFAPVDQMRQTR
ncbi:MAG: fused MFS/spermidine synthase [Actinomycetota bacterium]